MNTHGEAVSWLHISQGNQTIAFLSVAALTRGELQVLVQVPPFKRTSRSCLAGPCLTVRRQCVQRCVHQSLNALSFLLALI